MLIIVGISLLVAVAFAGLLKVLCRISRAKAALVAMGIWVAATVMGLAAGQQRLFAVLHQRQNDKLPQQDCLSYQPEFARLYASYRMTQQEFDAWVSSHPWKLSEGSDHLHIDGPALGLENPEQMFSSRPRSNGAQMRVYFKSETMYAAYYSM